MTKVKTSLEESTQLVPSTHDQPFPIIITIDLLTSIVEGSTYFGEEAVVVLQYYCFSKKQKSIMKRRSKRSREGQFIIELVSSKIIWKSSSDDPQGEAIEVVAAMGAFARANFHFVYVLNKALDEQKQKNVRMQNERNST